tara:strand:+ start:30 stop:212 length:183 start_codon:yes stop_codon:yes gene_type:complete
LESEALMNGELIARILMVLTGFALAFLGVIVFIHGQHYEVGILISFAGICSMFGGLPHYE